MSEPTITDIQEVVFVGHLIRRAQQIHTAAWATEVSDKVTSPQAFVLRALERESDMDQRTLARVASLDRSTAAGVVERLIARGQIERTRDPLDRRRNVLRITPLGEQVLHELEPRTREMNVHLLELLPTAERAQFVRLLRDFIASAEGGAAQAAERDAAG